MSEIERDRERGRERGNAITFHSVHCLFSCSFLEPKCHQWMKKNVMFSLLLYFSRIRHPCWKKDIRIDRRYVTLRRHLHHKIQQWKTHQQHWKLRTAICNWEMSNRMRNLNWWSASYCWRVRIQENRTEQDRLVSAKAERPNHPSHGGGVASQGGSASQMMGQRARGGGSSMTTMQIRLAVALGLKTHLKYM